MSLKKIISLCEKQGFFKKLSVSYDETSDFIHHLKLGPVGAMFQENLRNEWLQNIVIGSKNFNVFLSGPSFVDTFEYAKQMSSERAPFAIAEFLKKETHRSESNIIINNSNEQNDFRNVLLNYGNMETIFRITTFLTKSDAIPFFHKWQRQRKIWWRKISASPGRYNLTDIQENENGRQSVEIKSDFPWGSQVVESMSIYTCEHNRLQPHHLQLKEGRKKISPHFIVSNINLSSMILNFICDAYEEPPYHEGVRPMMRIHRKLAPYKVAFTLSTNAGVMNNLNDLALYLCKQFRNECISTLLTLNAPKVTQEVQWQQYDQMGIPYTVVLNDNTLRNGIAHLRSRDTTLKEQVHISTMLTYLQQIFKNY
ncbi:DNA polymerase subunit gamma-2, mitochondrial [Agrilus planipennis]|uniref:DNA polymerase subunit gamma-2, mitochondrial n=1 Tax=Agrilus planipennis TaxID=224129 RepID=A0A1W4WIE1_AGRPL|nr:DNA polymerase subunit gamma-2, mitochondrial [Agrilus planipennis]